MGLFNVTGVFLCFLTRFVFSPPPRPPPQLLKELSWEVSSSSLLGPICGGNCCFALQTRAPRRSVPASASASASRHPGWRPCVAVLRQPSGGGFLLCSICGYFCVLFVEAQISSRFELKQKSRPSSWEVSGWLD